MPAAAEKERSWYTAFYNFAEAMRELTQDKVNYKLLYSLVGLRGDYVNHESPAIRVSSAPALSRLIHSSRYASDFAERFSGDPGTFSRAADELASVLLDGREGACPELFDALGLQLWKRVLDGLDNERSGGRTQVNLRRADMEMQTLLVHCAARVEREGDAVVRLVLESYFHVMTFGHLADELVSVLVEPTPLSFVSPEGDRGRDRGTPCLVRIYGDGSVAKTWHVLDAPRMLVGRFPSCDIAEMAMCISREHCEIVSTDRGCVLRDLGSTHGSIVMRGDSVVYDSSRDEDGSGIALEYGDLVVLGGHVRYRLLALRMTALSSVRG